MTKEDILKRHPAAENTAGTDSSEVEQCAPEGTDQQAGDGEPQYPKEWTGWMTKGRMAALIVVVVLAIDQAIKIWVKTHMILHQRIHITDWFYLLFTENRGMAFGWEFVGKIFLTSFRIAASAFIIWYMVKLLRRGVRTGYIVCLALVLAGAAGNIFDSVFYGLMFNASTEWNIAEFVPFGTGYESVFMGKVVDMFYFPLVEFDWPQWLPLWGGEHFIFFSPIFNFADASISCGVIAILLFFRKELTRA
jgi:signal peptidase II